VSSELILNTFGVENFTVKIFDRDYRFDRRYLCRNLEDNTAAREEIIDALVSSDKRYFLFQGSDLGDLFSQSVYTSSKERREVEDYIKFLFQARHQNPNIEGCWFLMGVQSLKLIAKNIRRTVDLIVVKSAPPEITKDVLEMYPMVGKQKWLLRKLTRYVSIENIKQLAVILFPDYPREVYFCKPKYLLDLDKPKPKRVTAPEAEQEQDDGRIPVNLTPQELELALKYAYGSSFTTLRQEYRFNDRSAVERRIRKVLRECLPLIRSKD